MSTSKMAVTVGFSSLVATVSLLVVTLLSSGTAAANPPGPNPYAWLPGWLQDIIFCVFYGYCG
ncbi:hypothetical protein [Nocardia iowensis]|uniref:Uncharacterized protein n=1 Tax=Nocardia iowensis TaxID=204891 RepID=A0ABX8RW12_NOCIO|nr:hypothetical protein [Nocardia iowensis]QXN93843.1 hypothetical protein KV110_12700 [Nocardia iowensis]